MLNGILCTFIFGILALLLASRACLTLQTATPELIHEVKSMPGTQVEALRAAIDKDAPLSVYQVFQYTDIPNRYLNFKSSKKETPEANAQRQAIN